MNKSSVLTTCFVTCVTIMANAMSPLHEAARDGNNAAVEALLRSGAPVNATYNYGVTPLHKAVKRGHTAIVRTLLAAGANPNAETAEGVTPLFVASKHGHLAVVQGLLNAGAKVDGARGAIPLHAAIIYGHKEIMQALLSAGASPKIKDQFGCEPLYVAVYANKHELVKILLATPDIDINTSNIFGNTPLHIAIENGNQAIVETLLAAGAHVGTTKRFALQTCQMFVDTHAIESAVKKARANGHIAIVKLVTDYRTRHRKACQEMATFLLALHPRAGAHSSAQILSRDEGIHKNILTALRRCDR